MVHGLASTQSNINLLSIYNVARGKDSCGISIDDNIIYGLDNEASYENLVRNTIIPKPTKHNTISHIR